MLATDRDSSKWFAEAARCYIENHQGCPWCHGSHRVFHQRQRSRQIYCCQRCDFQVSFDEATGRYFHIVGESPKVAAETMAGN